MRTFVIWMFLAAVAWAQPATHDLVLQIEQGELRFPIVIQTPSVVTASQAPVLLLTDRRISGMGYRLEARLETPPTGGPEAFLEFAPGVPVVVLSPRGGSSLSPPRAAFTGGTLVSGESKVLLRADRSLDPRQGQGEWLVSLNPQAIRLRVPDGCRDQTYVCTLRFMLLEAP